MISVIALSVISKLDNRRLTHCWKRTKDKVVYRRSRGLVIYGLRRREPSRWRGYLRGGHQPFPRLGSGPAWDSIDSLRRRPPRFVSRTPGVPHAGPSRCTECRPFSPVPSPRGWPGGRPGAARWLASGAARHSADPCLRAGEIGGPHRSRGTGTGTSRFPERAVARGPTRFAVFPRVDAAAANEIRRLCRGGS